MATPKFLNIFLKSKPYSNRFTHAELINAESAIGRTLFGPIPAGHQREFFLISNNTWLWHESFYNNGTLVTQNIRYEVQPTGVYKSISGKQYQKLEGQELANFRKAVTTYFDLVKTKLYN